MERADAGFILSLRTDAALNRFIGPTSPQLADQLAWLDRYESRPGDWYFIITDGPADKPVGTIAIYDHDPATGTAEWGRWIIAPGVPAAIDSVCLMFRLGFERLGLESLFSLTNLANRAVVSFHDSCGVPRARVFHVPGSAPGEGVDAVEHRVTRALWSEIAPRLQALSRRLGEARHDRS